MVQEDSLSEEIQDSFFDEDVSPVTGLPIRKTESQFNFSKTKNQSQKDPTYGLGCVSKEKRRNKWYWYYTYYFEGKRYRKYICPADRPLPPEYEDIRQAKKDHKGRTPKHSTQ